MLGRPPPIVRFHFAKSDEVLKAALDRLDGWREKMAG